MKLKLTVGISLLLCAPAVAQDVYPGCEVPTTVAGRHTFFVDPVKGSDKGDGSMAKPWKSLNTVLAPASKLIATKSHKSPSGSPLLSVNPNAPIKGGDIIMLMSGDYGDITLINAFNDKFITVMPAPGQKPVLGHLKLAGVARWLFQGLTFQSAYPSGSKPSATGLVSISDGWGETTTNVILDQDKLQSTEDTSGWSDADWFVRPDYWSLVVRATCVSVTNSTIQNAMNGMTIIGPQALVKNNTIQRFSVDGIDVSTSRVAIVNNTIKDGTYNPSSSLHPDAIQVWSTRVNGALVKTESDILIDSNKIYAAKSSDGARGSMQGINVGFCDNVIIQNNVVAVNLWNAIYLGGARNSRIVNNTVASSDPTGHPSKIYVGPSIYNKSQNVVVRNNVSTDIDVNDTSVTLDHNAANRAYSILQGGKSVWHPATVSGQNLVIPTLNSSFRNWDPSKRDFDLHLKPGGPLDKVGAISLAPTYDADGRPRTSPVDLGAYTR